MRQSVLTNTSWILAERVIRIGTSAGVGLWMAAYLGPGDFGALSWAIAWAALFSTLTTLGLPHVISREVVAHPDQAGTILGTGFTLRVIGGSLGLVFSAGMYALFFAGVDARLVLVLFASLGTGIQAGEVIEYWLRGRLEADLICHARCAAGLLSQGVRIALILAKMPLLYFAGVLILEGLLISCLFGLVYLRHPARRVPWRFSWRQGYRILRDGLPLILAGLAITVYMKIDQVMIGALLGDTQVGVYSVAVRFSGLWYMVPSAITQSMMPSIIRERKQGNLEKYGERIIRLIALVFWLSVFAALGITMVGPQVLGWLLGQQFHAAGPVLQIHVWAGVFMALGIGIQQWYLAENRLSLDFYRTLAGAGINLGLNLVLIPRFGITGAAWATVAAQFFAAYFSACWFPSGRQAWRFLNRGIVYPFRVLWVST